MSEVVIEGALGTALAAAATRRLLPNRATVAIDAALGGESLSTVGARYGISRETVRRALSESLKELAANPGDLAEHPAVHWLQKQAPTDLDSAAATLMRRSWANDIAGARRAIDVLRRSGLLGTRQLSADLLLQRLSHGAPAERSAVEHTCGTAAIDQALANGTLRAITGAAPPHLARTLREPDEAAVPRKLRRMLALTGPLTPTQILAGWQRQHARADYVALPPHPHTLLTWAADTPGLGCDGNRIHAIPPIQLDAASRALQYLLKGHPEGVPRSQLLTESEPAGVSPATLAAALTWHPAITTVARGRWALRGDNPRSAPAQPRAPRTTPSAMHAAVTYTWDADGRLILEATHTGAPSPTLPIPAAVQEYAAAHQYTIRAAHRSARSATLKTRNRVGWGLAGLLTDVGIRRGQRYQVVLNLTTGQGELRAAEGSRE